MHIAVATILPGIFGAYLGESIMKRAAERGIVRFDLHNIRDFADDRHRTVDDSPFGGGPGMVMKAEPVARAIESITADGRETLVIMPSPAGEPFTQRMAEELAREERRLLFIAGRYEGIDRRVCDAFVDREISVGDYVLTGGELPALVIIDALVRLLPGAVGDEDSLKEESFSWGILDYPHYTRPAEWRGRPVPEVLLGGNHAEIRRYRRRAALGLTLRRRPDLLDGAPLTDDDRELLAWIKEDDDGLCKGS
jgi:tRNA (guanine37-N1)-methyltransferase